MIEIHTLIPTLQCLFVVKKIFGNLLAEFLFTWKTIYEEHRRMSYFLKHYGHSLEQKSAKNVKLGFVYIMTFIVLQY